MADNGSKAEETRAFIWQVLRHPGTDREHQKKLLGIKTQRGFGMRIEKLQKDGLVFASYALTEQAKQQFPRFVIHLATTYDQSAVCRERDLAISDSDYPDIRSYMIRDGEYTDYQSFVADLIRYRIRQTYLDDLALNSISVLHGSEWDLVLDVQAHDSEVVHQFVLRDVRTCPFVLRTSTAQARPIGNDRVNFHDEATDGESDETGSVETADR